MSSEPIEMARTGSQTQIIPDGHDAANLAIAGDANHRAVDLIHTHWTLPARRAVGECEKK